MPSLQQTTETLAGSDSLGYHGTDGDSVISIAELLGLDMPRGSLVGPHTQVPHSQGPHAQGPHTQGPHAQGLHVEVPQSRGSHGRGPYGQGDGSRSAPPPPLFMGSPTGSFSGDESGYQTSRPGSPLPHDMSTPGRSAPTRCRSRLDSGTFPQPPPSPTTPLENCYPRNVGSRPFRVGSHSISDRQSPLGYDQRRTLDQYYLMNNCSRSNSPESDTSVDCFDNMSHDLMNCLSFHARTRADSGLSTGFSSSCEEQREQNQQEVNLTKLHGLQSLNYQYNQQLQSPLSSPLSSPLAYPDKAWSPGSVTNSLSNSLSSSLPGSPLFMSSPLRGPASAPGTPPSPGSGSMMKISSLDSSRFTRNVVAPRSDATCTWSGTLPARDFDNPTFSVKVFLGGVPWDINEMMLVNGFKHFGMVRVEWPSTKQSGPPPKGYVYMIFECEKQVKALLQACNHDFSSGVGTWYFKVSSKRMKAKDVQVIPWMTSDTNWVRSPSQKLDPEKTVFVGGLHGMLNALGLANIMNDLFGGVVYAGIDTDKFKYPIGSARVTFNNNRSFFKAVNARFIEIKADKFTKKVQVDPYLEDSPCSLCAVQHGPYFCRESSCFRYFCRSCWYWRHYQDYSLSSHRALMRTSKSRAITDGSLGLNMSLPLKGQVRCDFSRQPVDSLQ